MGVFNTYGIVPLARYASLSSAWDQNHPTLVESDYKRKPLSLTALAVYRTELMSFSQTICTMSSIGWLLYQTVTFPPPFTMSNQHHHINVIFQYFKRFVASCHRISKKASVKCNGAVQRRLVAPSLGSFASTSSFAACNWNLLLLLRFLCHGWKIWKVVIWNYTAHSRF